MKPKRLVVVRFRQDRGRWEVDHANPPGVSPARSRPTLMAALAALSGVGPTKLERYGAAVLAIMKGALV